MLGNLLYIPSFVFARLLHFPFRMYLYAGVVLRLVYWSYPPECFRTRPRIAQ